MSQRVLVTGSEGFTGRYVCNEFARAGWEVWGAGVQPKPDNPRYLNINLLQPETLRGIGERAQPHAVVHLAASAFVAEADPTVFYTVNLLGTRHLLEELSTATPPPSCTSMATLSSRRWTKPRRRTLLTTTPSANWQWSTLPKVTWRGSVL